MANPTIATQAATAAAPASDMAAPAAKMQEAEKTLDMLEDDAVPVTHSGTEAAPAGEHATPSALGFDATMLVALAMLVVVASVRVMAACSLVETASPPASSLEEVILDPLESRARLFCSIALLRVRFPADWLADRLVLMTRLIWDVPFLEF